MLAPTRTHHPPTSARFPALWNEIDCTGFKEKLFRCMPVSRAHRTQTHGDTARSGITPIPQRRLFLKAFSLSAPSTLPGLVGPVCFLFLPSHGARRPQKTSSILRRCHPRSAPTSIHQSRLFPCLDQTPYSHQILSGRIIPSGAQLNLDPKPSLDVAYCRFPPLAVTVRAVNPTPDRFCFHVNLAR